MKVSCFEQLEPEELERWASVIELLRRRLSSVEGLGRGSYGLSASELHKISIVLSQKSVGFDEMASGRGSARLASGGESARLASGGGRSRLVAIASTDT